MKNKILKQEALDFFNKNPKVNFAGYDIPKEFIKDLYKLGAKKVYVVQEYPSKDDLENFTFIDTLYIVVGKNISTELAIFLIDKARTDECSYLKQHKSIRLWWD